MAIPAGIVSFSAEATAQPDMDTDIRTETETTKQLNTLRTGYNHPGLSSPRAHAAIVIRVIMKAIVRISGRDSNYACGCDTRSWRELYARSDYS